MTRDVFDQALEYLFRNEGSKYTNDIHDAGGPTRWGVTLKFYSAFLGRGVTPEEIAGLSAEDVKPFYRASYWKTSKCDEIDDDAKAIAVFDTSVLYGTGRCAKLVQQALALCGKSLMIDGVMGPTTLALLNSVPRTNFLEALRRAIVVRIGMIIKQYPENDRFRKGWLRRADRLLTLKLDTALLPKDNS